MTGGPDETVPLSRGATVAGYRIRDVLHTEPTGAVFSAVHPLSGVKATVRLIATPVAASDEAFAAFDTEAKRMACLDHPGIIQVTITGGWPITRRACLQERSSREARIW